MSKWQLIRYKDARRTREFWSELKLSFEYPVHSNQFENVLGYRTVVKKMGQHIQHFLTQPAGSSRPFREEMHSISRCRVFRRPSSKIVSVEVLIHAEKPSQRLFPSYRDLDDQGSYAVQDVCGRFGLPPIPDGLLCQWLTESLGEHTARRTQDERMYELRKAGTVPVQSMVKVIQKRAMEETNIESRLRALLLDYNLRCKELSESEDFLTSKKERYSPDIMDIAELSFAKMDKWATIDFAATEFRSIPEEVLKKVATPLSERLLALEQEDSNDS